MADRSAVTAPKINPSRRSLSSGEKQIIVNCYKSVLREKPAVKYDEVMARISTSLGVSLNNVRTTISEYKASKTVTSPNQTQYKPVVSDGINEVDISIVRKMVHSLWSNRKLPTLDKILLLIKKDNTLPNTSRNSLNIILKRLNFRKAKKNSLLVERSNVISWRRNYLRSIRKYREEGRPIYFLDDTYLNTTGNQTVTFLGGLSTDPTENPAGQEKRFYIQHIGSEEGFLPGGLLFLKLKNNTADDEMSDQSFRDWFKEKLALLKDNAVIVIKSSYNLVKSERIPKANWKKEQIVEWLLSKDEKVDPTVMVKIDLLEIVKRLKPKFNTYVVDEIAKEANKIVLRVPPYHNELNPFEMIWPVLKQYVKANNTTSKTVDVQHLLCQAIDGVNEEDWQSIICRMQEEEQKLWEVDFITDELIDELDPNTRRIVTTVEFSDFSDNEF